MDGGAQLWAHYLLLAASSASGATSDASIGASSTEVFSIAFSALDLGVAGVMLLLFIQGKLHSSEEMERERARADKAEQQRDEALGFIRDRLAPLVSEFTSSTGALIPILQGLVARLELTGREDSIRDRDRRERR